MLQLLATFRTFILARSGARLSRALPHAKIVPPDGLFRPYSRSTRTRLPDVALPPG